MEIAVIGRILTQQKDKAGYHEPCIAQTNWGPIPCKCKGNTCWIPYDGKEHTGNNFDRIVGTEAAPIKLVSNSTSRDPPKGTVTAVQNDSTGKVYAAVAETNWGPIPGKAKGDSCLFPYDGKEQSSKKFHWIVRVQP